MYGLFITDITEGKDKEKSWLWMRQCDLKIPTEALICFTQEQAIRVLILLVYCVVRRVKQLIISGVNAQN